MHFRFNSILQFFLSFCLTVIFSSLTLAQVDENAVAYYDFDESFGNIAYDLSSNNYHGTVINGTIVSGKTGNARSFTKSPQGYVTFGNIPLPQYEGTVEMWVKPRPRNSYQNHSHLFVKGINGHSGSGFTFFMRIYDDGHLDAGRGSYGSGITYLPTPPGIITFNDTWQHISFTWSQTETNWYVDCELVATGGAMSIGQTSHNVSLCKWGDLLYPETYYEGEVDGLIIKSVSEGNSSCIEYVNFDIKPGSCPNPLNVNAGNPGVLMIEENTVFAAKGNPNIEKVQAVFPVAILGTDDFDVNNIDPSTITLSSIAPERWGYEDVSTPISEDAEICECNILGGDGYTDMILKFDRSAIITFLGTVFDGDVIELTISGELYDGAPFEGSDCVVIRGDSAPIADRFGDDSRLPTIFSLNQNYPNPFNPVTEISYSLPKAGYVKLEIYNTLGQRVVSLIDEQKEAGVHTVNWDASNNASGIYLYKIQTGDFVETKKMMLLK